MTPTKRLLAAPVLFWSNYLWPYILLYASRDYFSMRETQIQLILVHQILRNQLFTMKLIWLFFTFLGSRMELIWWNRKTWRDTSGLTSNLNLLTGTSLQIKDGTQESESQPRDVTHPTSVAMLIQKSITKSGTVLWYSAQTPNIYLSSKENLPLCCLKAWYSR